MEVDLIHGGITNTMKARYLAIMFMRVLNIPCLIVLSYAAARRVDYGKPATGEFACIAWIFLITLFSEATSYLFVFHPGTRSDRV